MAETPVDVVVIQLWIELDSQLFWDCCQGFYMGIIIHWYVHPIWLPNVDTILECLKQDFINTSYL